MDNLFEKSDFTLFTQYQGKTQDEAPEGFEKLREIYDKLGKVLDKLSEMGYHTQIKRNPLIQGGPGILKYSSYHWSKVYPKDVSHFRECDGKVFVVIGSTEEGIDIHIDSNSRNGFDSDKNKTTKALKNDTWHQIDPAEAAKCSDEELAQMVDDFFQDNWVEYNQFAKEFGIQKSIEILNIMDIQKTTRLLISNHNLILTGAPGTGKTYLAKEIAQQMVFGEVKEKMTDEEQKQFNEQCAFVQFHPSYDYTDFVEGLRPVQDDGGNVGFERKDGVFKDFCKKALPNSSFELCYYKLLQDIKDSMNYRLLQKSGDYTVALQVNDKDEICWTEAGNSDKMASTKVTLNKLRQLFAKYDTSKKASDMSNINDEIRDIIGGVNSTYYWAVLNEVLRRLEKKYVFIIDEINRGEISKIFGEIFFSIDSGYRGKKGKVKTQYQNLIKEDDVFYDGFYVSENVYIIGTMNDIDRSVESMDFAFRRRFAFKEIKANDRVEMLYDSNNGVAGYVDEAAERMNRLNKEIEKIEGLSTAYHIGPAYFLKLKNYDGDFQQLWDNHLEGLLCEYLRGMQNVYEIMEKLKAAYDDESDSNN